MQIPDRSLWLRALSATPREALRELTKELTQEWEIRHKSLPQSGLGMLKLADGAFGEPFYLGEVPLATAWVEIRLTDGQLAEGAAQFMDDDIQHARHLALCDAILAQRLSGWERLAEVMQSGLHRLQAEARRRQAMLSKTRVDFSLLDAVGDNDAD